MNWATGFKWNCAPIAWVSPIRAVVSSILDYGVVRIGKYNLLVYTCLVETPSRDPIGTWVLAILSQPSLGVAGTVVSSIKKATCIHPLIDRPDNITPIHKGRSKSTTTLIRPLTISEFAIQTINMPPPAVGTPVGLEIPVFLYGTKSSGLLDH